MEAKISAVIEQLIQDNKNLSSRVEKLEKVKPVVVNGKDGKDGVNPAVEDVVEAVLTQLPEPEKIDPYAIVKDVVALLPEPRAGRDAPPVSVSDVAAIVLAKIEKPKDGAPGKDGKDAPPIETIAKRVQAQVQDGKRGERGPRGEKGPPGKDGVSVTDVQLNNNDLFVFLDGLKKKAGRIRIPFSPGGGGGGAIGLSARPNALSWEPNYSPGDTVQGLTAVLDEGFLMASNKTTNDPAAPIPENQGIWFLPDTPAWVADTVPTVSNTGVVFEPAALGVLAEFRGWVPETGPSITNTFYLSDITDPSVPILLFTLDLTNATAGVWNTLAVPPILVNQGRQYRATLITQKFTTQTQFTFPWLLLDDDGIFTAAEPGPGEYSRTINFSQIKIHKTDSDSVDRSVSLADLKAGDTFNMLEQGSSSRFNDYQINSVLDEGAFITFEVTRTQQNGSVREGRIVDITGFAAQGLLPAPFVRLDNYWDGFDFPDGVLDIQGFEVEDFPPQPADYNNNAYGIDIRAVELKVSDDWDFMALSDLSTITAKLTQLPGLNRAATDLPTVKIIGSLTEAFTTSDFDTAPETKVSDTFNCAAGLYKVTISFEGGSTSNSRSICAQLIVDGTPVDNEHEQEPQDDDNQLYITKVTTLFLSAGPHDASFIYGRRGGGGGDPVFVRNVRIFFERVL